MQSPAERARDLGGYGAHFAERGAYRVAVAGAASGIGLAVAQRLHTMRCTVLALDADAKGLRALEENCPGIAALRVDLLDDGATRATLAGLPAASAKLDALINCVGITGRTNVPAAEVDIGEFDRIVTLNLRGALTLSQAVLPGMIERGYGRVLHVASIAGKEGNPGMAAYSASKAALIGLVKSMAKDCATTGVTVNALAPAVIRTPLVDALPQATVEYMTQRIPMQRCGTLEEAASMVAWIVSPACSFCTGFTFDLSGGRATY